MKKEETGAYHIFKKLTQTLARDLQQFLILSPAHDISANHLQIVVHLVKVTGKLTRRIEVWATITDTKYVSTQAKLLTIVVTKENVLQMSREMPSPEILQHTLAITQYNELRDVVCTQAMTMLLEESDLRKAN